MAIKGLRLGETWEYTSRFDTEPENPTVWLLGTLDSEIHFRLMDQLAVYKVNRARPEEEPEMKFNAFERQIKTIQHGLKGWKNFQDAQGKELEFHAEKEFNRDVVAMELIRQIPARVITELADEILKGNTLAEDESKN